MRTGVRLHRKQELIKSEILTLCIGFSIVRRIDKNDMFTPTSSGKMPRAIQSFRLIRGPTEEHEVWDITQLRIVGTKEQWYVCGEDLAVNLRVAVADVWLSHGLQKWSHWAGKKKHGWEIKPAAEDQMLKGVQFLGRSGHQVVRSWS